MIKQFYYRAKRQYYILSNKPKRHHLWGGGKKKKVKNVEFPVTNSYYQASNGYGPVSYEPLIQTNTNTTTTTSTRHSFTTTSPLKTHFPNSLSPLSALKF